ncbi:MAG: hypothetical protein UR39_C0001G0150 [Candidatus Woesebacteria bacterium GW2011_GWA1_33_30]|uniref:Uncharacterized protein n=1 Tax=Candidatus Woesebacteria bacterium GW2011_GWA2_33_28 TaxID=1618561 RepID=A0A0G0CAW6_9BACT|nr:MAG: hypothetical protein UR38_C0001G0151 [Candidatus Woesebacteria bacterium GW2011_GWA2_33_28]KKP49117.1 MAG: hypothetical protein UR39_C0001G0150 [Candidatus Woesebacteria bacterium GW2011_GWA1_33_30]KKP50283.1 MAG: hypothetical protein UR40_C0001G0025 [Microgenomates group bacterium GW2011_GWC1_33_32]KKP52708.1 MAG: hypothetical protein UR44_C0001G0150 [Candidatus Woesebacteria bacterium GW2011_GWB1_33_38]KKP58709.1 MAG: hypothetical protein UR48_C0002G0005 [Microgenomates group bacteriu
MTKKDKKEIVDLFNQGITELVLPVLDDMNEKMATKDDIQELRLEIGEVKENVGDIQKQLDTIPDFLHSQ